MPVIIELSTGHTVENCVENVDNRASNKPAAKVMSPIHFAGKRGIRSRMPECREGMPHRVEKNRGILYYFSDLLLTCAGFCVNIHGRC